MSTGRIVHEGLAKDLAGSDVLHSAYFRRGGLTPSFGVAIVREYRGVALNYISPACRYLLDQSRSEPLVEILSELDAFHSTGHSAPRGTL
jgi:hypothetical protein